MSFTIWSVVQFHQVRGEAWRWKSRHQGQQLPEEPAGWISSDCKLIPRNTHEQLNMYELLQPRVTAPDIDVNRLVNRGDLAKANTFTQQLQRSMSSKNIWFFGELCTLNLDGRAIFARQNDPRNMGKSLTDCLSGSVQVKMVWLSSVDWMWQACRANPSYQYVEMGRVNLSEMPPRLARSSFTDGYFCELRVQVIGGDKDRFKIKWLKGFRNGWNGLLAGF